jgi:hypothetical protein
MSIWGCGGVGPDPGILENLRKITPESLPFYQSEKPGHKRAWTILGMKKYLSGEGQA